MKSKSKKFDSMAKKSRYVKQIKDSCPYYRTEYLYSCSIKELEKILNESKRVKDVIDRTKSRLKKKHFITLNEVYAALHIGSRES